MNTPYQNYVRTNLDWFSEAPSHWSLLKVAWHLPFVTGWTPSTSQAEYFEGDNTWVSIEDMKSKVVSISKKNISDQAVSDKGMPLVPRGSLLFSFKLSVGKVAFAGVDLYTNEAIAAFLPNDKVSLRFLYYAAPIFLPKYGQNNIYGSLLMNRERIEKARTFVPPIHEQETISNYLDREVGRIDDLVSEKKNFISLLKEKRQALISHVVTKGLDSNVEMKDSGVEWIGEIPKHWTISKLKFESQIVDCKNRTPEYFDDGKYLVVRTSNVRNQKLKKDGAYFTDEENFRIWTLRGVPPEGSILFTREAPAGECCKVPVNTPLCLGQRMMNIIPKDAKLTDYILNFLYSDSVKQYIKMESSGSTVTHLRVGQVYNLYLPIPPDNEIDLIIEKIQKEVKKIDLLTSEVLDSITLLKEHRTALISAAVTGKIDLREKEKEVA